MSNSKKYLYILFISELNISKIGISGNVEKRTRQLQTGCPYKIDVVKKYHSEISTKIEKIMHRKYANKKLDENHYNLIGEWFNISIGEVLMFEQNCKEIEETIRFLRTQGNPYIK